MAVSRWRVLLYVYIAALAFAVTFQAIPPILGPIISSFGISHGQAGALMSFFALPGILISIPGGILTDIYGPKRVGTGALVITLAGSLLVGLGGNYSMLVIGRLITGIGALTISIVTPQMISRWFSEKDLGRAMGIFNTAMPVGTILVLNTFGRLALRWNWRVPVLLTALYSLFVLVIFYFRYPGLPGDGAAPEKPPEPEKFAVKKMVGAALGAGGAVWLVAIIWMTYNGAAISYLTFAGDYYGSVGYDAGYAGFLTSLFMVGSLLFCPLMGYLTDRVGKEAYFIIIGCALLTLLLLLVPGTGLNPLLLGSLIGIAAAFIPAPVYALIPKSLPPDQLGMGYGILSTCLNIGILLGPLLVGLSYDWGRSYVFGFILMAIFSAATALVALLLLRLINPR